MEYPVYITRQEASRYRGWLPDFPGVDVEGDSYSELANAANDRVNALYDQDARLVPCPTTDMAALQASCIDDGEGIWRFIDIARPTSCSVLVLLCLPKTLVEKIDAVAKSRRISRETLVAECTKELGVPALQSSCRGLVLA
ncbi:TPA: type II toxin-antitoxin system HicB family antitoxin [Burkholderia stabilis]|nr:type II toxin-antitoxin system HicB family antitoxin [Burkholderia stabilis]HDR9649746.1 type II toxin-antitoxin system HicB family antitoxin [Burkholderia stabilis]HDR9655487.1 type II toxin-antitoxin system HicB family antitoxin [Burkholderia stabilis]HDR9679812.1 type II toxin-antitoxin system HicB family antitoxin [Burkholderia stabilis]